MFPVIIFIIVSPMLYLMSRYTDYGLLIASALFSLVYYAWQPSQNYLIAKYTRKASHGKGFGVNFFLIFGMGSMATAIGGYVADEFGVDVFYNYMSIIGFIAIAAALAVFAAKPYLLKVRFWTVKERIDMQ